MNKIKLATILKTWNKLSKFRLSMMNALMPLAGCYSAMGCIDPKIGVFLFAGNLFLAMSSQINGQLYERDYDKMMARTCNRPLITEKVSPKQAIIISWSLYGIGNMTLITFCSLESILISNTSYWMYFVYMWLKRNSKWNLPFGGIVGCLPILSGAIVIDGFDAVNKKVIFDLGFLYIWQMTHFLQILMMNKDDYSKAGFVQIQSRNNIFYFQLAFFILHIVLVINLPGNEAKDWILKALISVCLVWQIALLHNFKKGIAPYSITLKEKKLAYSVAFLYFAFYHSKKIASKNQK